MNKKTKFLWLIVGIIILASTIRFYNITNHDSYTDEGILAFRSLGLIDYNAAYHQTTPWQWVSEVPWWAHLSFHDHPIFFFLVQHSTISLFGENMLGVRMPAALAGVTTVFLVFLVGKQLFNKKIGLLAAFLLSVQSYHVWISRLGIQDSLVIFFSLLILWLWLQALEKEKWWLWVLWGGALGLGIITKYTVLIIVPVLLVHALIFKHKIHKNKFFWLGAVSTLVISSPSWLYNMLLYKNFGHFDFQISALMGQEVSEWQFRQGRQMTGGFLDRIRFFFEALNQSSSKLFNCSVIISFLTSIFLVIKRHSKVLLFLILTVVLQALWFLVIGSTLRFVVMIVPYLILLLAYIFVELVEWTKYKKIVYLTLVVFFSFEMLFTANSFLMPSSWGSADYTYAEINKETQHFGFNELDKYLGNFLENKASSVLGQPKYKFIADLQSGAMKEAETNDYEKYPLIIIYDKDFNLISRLWVFQRRLIYYSWPAITDEIFFDIAGEEWDGYYRKQGVEHFLYATGVAGVDFDVDKIYEPYSKKIEKTILEKYLEQKGIEPEYIKNKYGEEIFAIYKF